MASHACLEFLKRFSNVFLSPRRIYLFPSLAVTCTIVCPATPSSIKWSARRLGQHGMRFTALRSLRFHPTTVGSGTWRASRAILIFRWVEQLPGQVRCLRLARRVVHVTDFQPQSAILACSWAKIPVLLSSFDVWIRQRAAGRAYFTIPQLKEERLAATPRPGTLYHRAYITADGDDESAATMTMREKLCFDFDCFMRYILPPRKSHPPPGKPHVRILGDGLRALLGTHLEVHPGTKIPKTLLAGPFESDHGAIDIGVEKMRRLFWLVRGGASLQDDQTWESTEQGFHRILQLVANVEARHSGDNHDDHDDHDDVEPPSGQGEPSSSPPPLERLKLAAALLALFDFLGVFDNQWPRYILQMSQLQVSRLVLSSAPQSAQEALLNRLAYKLRCMLLLHGQRPRARDVGMPWAARRERPRAYDRQAGFADICRQRAGMFLCLPEGIAEWDNPPSPAIGAALGELGHEPWSGFWLD
jgi:hypothetical protein